MTAALSGLTIGSLNLAPEFDPQITEYTAETENASNKITATPEDAGADITITIGETEIENGAAATWQEGENKVIVKCINGDAEKTYTVTVTKT